MKIDLKWELFYLNHFFFSKSTIATRFHLDPNQTEAWWKLYILVLYLLYWSHLLLALLSGRILLEVILISLLLNWKFFISMKSRKGKKSLCHFPCIIQKVYWTKSKFLLVCVHIRELQNLTCCKLKLRKVTLSISQSNKYMISKRKTPYVLTLSVYTSTQVHHFIWN